MTITMTLTELLLTILLLVAIYAVLELALVLKNLIPTLKHLNSISADAEVMASIAKEKTESLSELADEAQISLKTVFTTLKGNQNVVKGATNFVNAATSLIGLAKKSGDKQK